MNNINEVIEPYFSFRTIGLSILLFLNCTLYAQDYSQVDATIELYPDRFESPEKFSQFLTRDFNSEEEKVRAIYTWIIKNVSYDPDEYKKFDFKFKNYRERNLKEEKTREKIIKRTLKTGVAVCEGYALLFEKLCELQGITNYLVRGDTKSTFKDIGRNFDTNHMWNVALIDGQAHLFDPTWGAGRFNGKFIKDPTYFYYKTPPELFFNTHYPDMYEDAFMDQLISKEVFANLPLIIVKDLTIDDVELPISGVVYSDAEEKALFRIRKVSPKKITYAYDGSEPSQVNQVSAEGNAVSFEVPIELGMDRLLIYFDDRPALGFKVK